jgi:hypothetical protein
MVELSFGWRMNEAIAAPERALRLVASTKFTKLVRNVSLKDA